jgi:ribonuclease HII
MPAGRLLTASLEFERDYNAQGFKRIAGIDEAGRGAWAGPVAAGAVVLPPDGGDLSERLHGARDSKTMTARERGRLCETIQGVAAAWGMGMATVAEICALGIAPATKLAMRRALLDMTTRACHIWPDLLFIDYVALENSPVSCPQVVRPQFDAHSLTVACASIIAKHMRDTHMAELDARHPGYGFGRHKGYGTASHASALDELGPCEAHRTTFAPIAQRRLL